VPWRLDVSPASSIRAAAFVLEQGLTLSLHENGFVLVDRDPDYVVVGEGRNLRLKD
jgi:NagD protein